MFEEAEELDIDDIAAEMERLRRERRVIENRLGELKEQMVEAVDGEEVTETPRWRVTVKRVEALRIWGRSLFTKAYGDDFVKRHTLSSESTRIWVKPLGGHSLPDEEE